MFEEKVFDIIKKFNMIAQNDLIIVAVSGGPDSMALLNALLNLKEKLNFNIVVAHVNHMIRDVADEETRYVKDFCDMNKIECYIKKIDVIKKAELERISTEEAGRNARYEFFEEIFEITNANKIAVAHNANDNAETVIMNIIRGTGVSGLKGIDPVRANKYIRPLIEIGRPEIEEYCNVQNLNPKYDESNNENIYTRNKVRNLLIPYLKKEFNPSIIDAINRLSELATQESAYVEKTVNKNFEEICESKTDKIIILNLKKFNQLDYFIKSKVLLVCADKLFNTTKGIEKKHIEDVIKLCEKNVGNKYLTPNKFFKILVNKGKIVISREN